MTDSPSLSSSLLPFQFVPISFYTLILAPPPFSLFQHYNIIHTFNPLFLSLSLFFSSILSPSFLLFFVLRFDYISSLASMIVSINNTLYEKTRFPLPLSNNHRHVSLFICYSPLLFLYYPTRHVARLIRRIRSDD